MVSGLTRREVLLGIGSAGLTAALPGHEQGSPAPVRLRSRVSFGAYAAPEPWPSIAAHTALEHKLRARLPTMSWFQSWENAWLHKQAAEAAATSHDLLIAWEPWHDDRTPILPADVVAGRHDRRIADFLKGAGAHPGEVTIRLGHEMNGGGYPWAVGGRHSVVTSVHGYVGMYRYVVTLARRLAPRIRWMWCVNALDIGGPPAEAYWPGDGVVDVLGIDAYNGYGPWTSAHALLGPMHDRLRRLAPHLDIWVAELGCREAGPGEQHSKAEWFASLFDEEGLPALKKLVFFHAHKERNWLLDSTPGALAAVQRGLASR